MAMIDAKAMRLFVLIPALISLILFIAVIVFIHHRLPRAAACGDGDWLNRAWLTLWASTLWLSIF